MAQAPEVCGVSLHICRARVTRLDDTGDISLPPNNSYVSDTPTTVQLTPTIEAGVDSTLKGGCDCIVATYQGPDILKGFTFEFANAAIEPAMLEMMLGADVILDDSDSPVPIGIWHPGPIDCGSTTPKVGFEFWTDVWNKGGSSQNTDWPFLHHVYPSTTWVQAAQTYQNEFATPGYTGKARANSAWLDGPYGDQPEAVPTNSPGGFFYEVGPLPEARCGYLNVNSGS